LAGKTDFTELYEAEDPRDYYLGLAPLEYQAPAHAAPVFRHLAEVLGRTRVTPTVLDVCCSFGVNAALLNHDLTLDDLRQHYVARDPTCLNRCEVMAADRHFFASHRRLDAVDMIGLDVAPRAVEYAVGVGLLVDGVVADLEAIPAPTAVTSRLAHVDLVIITGGGSYVSDRTFDTIVASAAGEVPWIAALTLRWIGFDGIATALGRHGLVTERLEGYLVRQRRFTDEDERAHVISSLSARGMQPTPLEESGWHCAEMFVARPRKAVRDVPLGELLEDCPYLT
jgi:SAM-dependent methyltransferase